MWPDKRTLFQHSNLVYSFDYGFYRFWQIFQSTHTLHFEGSHIHNLIGSSEESLCIHPLDGCCEFVCNKTGFVTYTFFFFFFFLLNESVNKSNNFLVDFLVSSETNFGELRRKPQKAFRITWMCDKQCPSFSFKQIISSTYLERLA